MMIRRTYSPEKDLPRAGLFSCSGVKNYGIAVAIRPETGLVAAFMVE